MRQVVSAVVAALSVVCLSAGAVLAAPPSNDSYAGAITITTVPFTDTLETTGATTDALDDELNAECFAPATDASVWYKLIAPADMRIIVDASGSDYGAGIIVATGTPGDFELIACGPRSVAFEAEDGVTYTLLIFDDQEDQEGNGGTLELVVTEAPPLPEVDVTVAGATFGPKTDTATVSGTVTCPDGTGAFISVNLSQTVGRFIIRGFGDNFVECDGTAQEWTVEIFPETGVFRGGKASVEVFAEVCDGFGCGSDFEETHIRLRR